MLVSEDIGITNFIQIFQNVRLFLNFLKIRMWNILANETFYVLLVGSYWRSQPLAGRLRAIRPKVVGCFILFRKAILIRLFHGRESKTFRKMLRKFGWHTEQIENTNVASDKFCCVSIFPFLYLSINQKLQDW